MPARHVAFRLSRQRLTRCAIIGTAQEWLFNMQRSVHTVMTNHYRTRRGVNRRIPLVNCKRQLLVPVSVVDVCPMWQDKGFPDVGIPPSTLFYYYPDGRWLLGRPTGRGAFTEWETLRPLDARHWLLDNGFSLDELSENMRAALNWNSNHSEERRTNAARIACEDKVFWRGGRGGGASRRSSCLRRRWRRCTRSSGQLRRRAWRGRYSVSTAGPRYAVVHWGRCRRRAGG